MQLASRDSLILPAHGKDLERSSKKKKKKKIQNTNNPLAPKSQGMQPGHPGLFKVPSVFLLCSAGWETPAQLYSAAPLPGDERKGKPTLPVHATVPTAGINTGESESSQTDRQTDTRTRTHMHTHTKMEVNKPHGERQVESVFREVTSLCLCF